MNTIASNAGVEGAVVVGKLLEQDNPDLGYDAAKGFPLSNIFYLPYYLFGVLVIKLFPFFMMQIFFFLRKRQHAAASFIER